MSALFADLIGQPRAVALLEAVLEQQRLAPAYLFSGADGVGRRLAAQRFLEGVIAGTEGSLALRRRLMEGNHPDLLWVEPTYSHQGQLIPISQAEEQGLARRALPQLRLEQVRGVARFLGRRPVEASRCLVVLEQVEAMAEGAANALLKTLEEPGDGLLILITATPERLLSTIRSRCQQIPFVRLDPTDLDQVLAAVGQRTSQALGDGEDPAELRAWRPVHRGRCCATGACGRSCPRGWRNGYGSAAGSPLKPWPWPGISPRPWTWSSSSG